MRIYSKLAFFMVIDLLSWIGFATCATGQESTLLERQTLRHNGLERSYVVRVLPRLIKSGEQVPLVLVLHGGGGNAAHAERMTGFTPKARQDGFMVVYPEGTGHRNDTLLTWNAGHCCGFAMDNQVDDVGFINALLDTLMQTYPVDPKRVYATGMSNGGMMVHRLGIELSARFAAIAPVVATLFGDEATPEQPVSALMLNGMLDESVPYQGGSPGGRFPGAWDGTPALPALKQAEFWAAANGCESVPEQRDQPAFLLFQYRCPANRGVTIYLIKDQGHAWPGGQQGRLQGDPPSSGVNGTDLIWEFFRTHPQ